jgi:predicted PurR-regulated permease PerM
MNGNTEHQPRDEWSGKVTETAIRLGVLVFLLIWCYRILQPFIAPVLWGIIIAVAIFPIYDWLVGALRGRRGLAATLITLLIFVVLMVPAIMLTTLLVENVMTLAQEVRHKELAIPLPPDSVREWPLIGEAVAHFWNLAATNLAGALKLVQPQLTAMGAWLLDVAARAGFGVIMFVFAIVIAGFLLAFSASGHRIVHGVSRRLVGERGEDLANTAEATIRSVARGVLGVAVIQAMLAGLGFMVAGVPAAGIWALLCLITATVQIGVGPVVIPVIVYMFATGDTLTAVLFLIWNALIMVLDNILKPLLLGRGVDVPMVVIFLGSIGGLLLSGIVGLFLGAIVLALGYKLFQTWLNMESPVRNSEPGQ